jgi:hypothetical protein
MLKRSSLLALAIAALVATSWSHSAGAGYNLPNGLSTNGLSSNGVSTNATALQALRLRLPDATELTFR